MSDEVSDIAIVALLDALGTKGILGHDTPNGVMDRWQKLLDELGTLCDATRKQPGCQACSFTSFSDTVIVYVVPENPDAIPTMLGAMNSLLKVLVWQGMKEGIFLRGCLTTGRFIKKSSKMLGESLEEASAWYEKTNWMGIIATPSATHWIERLRLQGWQTDGSYIHYPVPMSQQSIYETWAIDWPGWATRADEHSKEILLRSFGTYAGGIFPEFAAKYSNTLKFAEFVWDKHRLSTTDQADNSDR